MPKQTLETIEERVEQLTATVQQLETETAALKARVKMFTPTEWAEREHMRKVERERKETQERNGDAGQAWAEDNGYPELQGSVKQIRWASAIRHQLVEKFRKEQPCVAAEVEESLREKTRAIWWISRAPRSEQETATELLSRHTINENTWSGERTGCPGVVIPGTARDTPSWVN